MTQVSEPNTIEEVVLKCEGVSKRFPGVVANDKVDLEIRRGEIHALLGENGAGKTTLMNCVYGLYCFDEGCILRNEKPMNLKSPADAIDHKIGMIHQHFMLIPTLSVVENIALCLKDQKPWKLDLVQIEEKVLDLSKKYGLDINPRALVSDLSVGEQQRVEILKVLYREAEILIMDEPTAVLTPNEVSRLFRVLKDIVRQGNSIIFISHKLWEVLSISDRITVLRNGKKVSTVNTNEMTKERLAAMMVGREVILQYERQQIKVSSPILELINVTCCDRKGIAKLDDISFEVHGGEIVGIAGVDGNGQKELAEVIHGLQVVNNGQVIYQGEEISHLSAKNRMNLGISHIPEDRLTTGVIVDFSVAENIILIEFDQEPYTRKGFIRAAEVNRRTHELQESYDIRMSSIHMPLKNLSGGNQQKVVLAREISRKPKLLIAAQPTRGLDIGATEFVQRQLLNERNNGNAILLLSTDLDEILNLSDRILVLYEGKILGEAVPGLTSISEIGLMMAGVGTTHEDQI